MRTYNLSYWEDSMRKKQSVSRREFLTRSGLVVAAAAGGAASMGLVGFAPQQQASPWPWPYKEIDPEKAAQIAYQGYMDGHN